MLDEISLDPGEPRDGVFFFKEDFIGIKISEDFSEKRVEERDYFELGGAKEEIR